MSKNYDFSGIWHSAYHYVNEIEPEGNYSEHDVKIYRTGNQVVVQSIPNKEGSYLVARLTLDENLDMLTGTWEENASPGGIYKNQVYYGACQVQISPDKQTISGQLTYYNHEMKIKAGEWNLTKQKDSK